AGANCVLWGCTQVERALGGPVGPTNPPVSVTALGEGGGIVPNTASQGRLMALMKEGDIAPVPNAAGAVGSEMSSSMKVLKVGGRVFLVAGIAVTAYDIATAPEGEKGRTAAREVTGFAAGIAAGAAAGLVYGPGALVCSLVLGSAFGIAGTYAG